jgi:hypothetical protein
MISAEERAALLMVASEPTLSPGPGSNLWPLLTVWHGAQVHEGALLDSLLRRGLLKAVPLKQELFVQPHKYPKDYPDLYVTHRLLVSNKGRAALRAKPKSVEKRT